ncbi:MAG: tetratricopeptide repeat protein [Candidatus Entotheonellia bacterium]
MSSDSELSDIRQRAQSLALAGDWGETAIQLNTRMLEIDDRAADAYTRLARCFREQGRLSAAREMYTQVLTFDSGNLIARNNLAKIEKEIGQGDELSGIASIGLFDEAFAVGVGARRRKRYALAIAALSRAVELRPGSVHAWNALGAAHRHRGDLDPARSAYERALALARNVVSLIGLAAVAPDLRDHERAIDLYTEVLRGEPDQAYALNGLGGVYTDMGRLDEAEQCFRRASILVEGRADAVTELEMLRRQYEAQGDTAAAERIDRWLAQLAERAS